MSKNPWAQQASGKDKLRQKVSAVAQQNAQSIQALAQVQQMVYGLSYKLFDLEQKLTQAENVAKVADYRSQALSNVLAKASIGFTDDTISNEIISLQEKDFDTNSAADDVRRGLENADTETAANDLHAITTISVFKDGVELKDERIVRSKVEIGKAELFNGDLDAALVGLKVGDSKDFPLVIGNRIDTARVTLLGLRRAPAIAAVEMTEAHTEISNA